MFSVEIIASRNHCYPLKGGENQHGLGVARVIVCIILSLGNFEEKIFLRRGDCNALYFILNWSAIVAEVLIEILG